MAEMERSDIRKLQKEQERERRRLRDRQRRQSMSVEEREKHLARRRRNYQLRRLRAENARLDSDPQSQSQSQPTTPTDQILPVNSVSDLSLQCNDVGSHQECTKSESLQVPAHKLAKFSGQLRLNRLKHLARSLNDPVCDTHKISVDVMLKGHEPSNGISLKGLRLNRVKHLARSRNSAVKENISQNQPSQIEG
ncbi:hypothetical protein ACOSP7_015855 [Xanthoceras sorbifolium]